MSVSGTYRPPYGPKRPGAVVGECRIELIFYFLFSIFRRVFLLSFGTADFFNKFPEKAVIFLSGLRFHAAGNVNSVGAHNAHRRSYVFDVEAACQNDTAAKPGAARNVPIRGVARTTIFAL